MSRSPESPACDTTLERLEAYLDRQLIVDEVQEIDTHLKGCAACRADLDLASAIRDELRNLPELDAPDHVIEGIFEQTSRSQADPRLLERLHARKDRRMWTAFAAASFALLIVTFALVRNGIHPAPTAQAPNAQAIAQATAEARYALERAGLVTRQAGLQIRDRALRQHLVAPTVNSLDRSLHRSPSPPPESGGSAGRDTDQGVNDA